MRIVSSIIGRGRAAGIRRFDYIPLLITLSIPAGGAWGQPACRTAVDEPDFAFAAGCLVTHQDRMLVVRHRFGGKLGVPGGRSNAGESAQCVAHRETWEETGLDVEVHGMIRRFDNGFALYRCELVDPAAAAVEPLPVPRGARSEVTQIRWVDPDATAASDWRFPRDYPLILDLFDD